MRSYQDDIVNRCVSMIYSNCSITVQLPRADTSKTCRQDRFHDDKIFNFVALATVQKRVFALFQTVLNFLFLLQFTLLKTLLKSANGESFLPGILRESNVGIERIEYTLRFFAN